MGTEHLLLGLIKLDKSVAFSRRLGSKMTLDELNASLNESGIPAYFQNPNQLVIAEAVPPYPSVNSFWVTWFDGQWYLATWLPAIYRAPVDCDFQEIIVAVLKSSNTAIYVVTADLVKRYSLTRLTNNEVDIFMERP